MTQKIKYFLSAIVLVWMLVFAGCGISDSGVADNTSEKQTETVQTIQQTEIKETVQTDLQTGIKETEQTIQTETETETEEALLNPDGNYTSKEDVALYLHTYGELPKNFITKKEASNLGWDNKKGNLADVAPGKSIGGDRFGNYEGLLPSKDGRQYYECDIDYNGGYRGGKRIVFSNDGLIFYSEDHYSNFELLYE